jgi:hypothetical protein
MNNKPCFKLSLLLVVFLLLSFTPLTIQHAQKEADLQNVLIPIAVSYLEASTACL